MYNLIICIQKQSQCFNVQILFILSVSAPVGSEAESAANHFWCTGT